jgi:lysophospholipid acyltransferase (LPLAT)-like uncharacterized protein
MTASEAPRAAVKPRSLNWKEKTLIGVLYFLIRLNFLTLRLRFTDRSGQIKGGSGPLIFCIWHNRLALTVLAYERYFLKFRKDTNLAALISASRDGGVLAFLVEKFGIQPVRGSSSRRGAQALLEATSYIEKGYHMAITPDGPRGPCYSIQDGIIALAQLTGAPIIPVSNVVPWKTTLRSWDRFQIPLPFARCDVRIGPPIFVPRDASAQERERLRQELRRRMDNITED